MAYTEELFMKRVKITVLSPSSSDSLGPLLLFPKPYANPLEKCIHADFDNLIEVKEIVSKNYRQHAYLAKVGDIDKAPVITYLFKRAIAREPEPWFWQIQSNRHTTASSELMDEVQDLCNGLSSQQDKIVKVITHAANLFSYGHNNGRFNDGFDQVPSLCGTTKGSCIDINTYLIAATRCLDIPVQYIAGYWFHPDKTETSGMHCWLVFQSDAEIMYWDLAHHLKWGVSKLQSGLNPAGGRRVPMSIGRGIQFDTPHGLIELSHFSEPLWLCENGEVEKPKLKVQIED
jgi:hypothetical protein